MTNDFTVISLVNFLLQINASEILQHLMRNLVVVANYCVSLTALTLNLRRETITLTVLYFPSLILYMLYTQLTL